MQQYRFKAATTSKSHQDKVQGGEPRKYAAGPWSPELNGYFLNALNTIVEDGNQPTPTNIRTTMERNGALMGSVTICQVESHLQTYWLKLQRAMSLSLSDKEAPSPASPMGSSLSPSTSMESNGSECSTEEPDFGQFAGTLCGSMSIESKSSDGRLATLSAASSTSSLDWRSDQDGDDSTEAPGPIASARVATASEGTRAGAEVKVLLALGLATPFPAPPKAVSNVSATKDVSGREDLDSLQIPSMNDFDSTYRSRMAAKVGPAWTSIAGHIPVAVPRIVGGVEFYTEFRLQAKDVEASVPAGSSPATQSHKMFEMSAEQELTLPVMFDAMDAAGHRSLIPPVQELNDNLAHTSRFFKKTRTKQELVLLARRSYSQAFLRRHPEKAVVDSTDPLLRSARYRRDGDV
eukprot:TRINITY_DN8319_c0_g1_i1.p1 TRINITY_DN8319_c0_g1~~TRINITY_DN8319_c0_g1_i1.p1  ORF type:complete len:406 (-),score=57.52 TRINITY_DN8319_c0_g1_i1:675-1892(-)